MVRRVLVVTYATRGTAPRPATLVRGSSRRNHDYAGKPLAWSANNRMISRRHSDLDRCLVCFTEKKSRGVTKP